MDHPVDVTSRESEIWDGNGRTVRSGGGGFGTICTQAERLGGRRRDLREGESRRPTSGPTPGFTQVGGERKAGALVRWAARQDGRKNEACAIEARKSSVSRGMFPGVPTAAEK